MKELLIRTMAGLFRIGLGSVSTWLISQGVIDQADSEKLIAGLAFGAATLALVVWDKVVTARKLNTALALPNDQRFTIEDVERMIREKRFAPAATPKDETPVIRRQDGTISSNTPLMLFLVLIGGLGAFACAGATPPPSVPNTLPPVVDTVDGNLRAGAMKALGILEATIDVGDQALTAYLEAFKTGGIPAAADQQIRAGFRKLADDVIAAVGKIKAGLREWSELRAVLQPIVDTANSLVNVVRQLGESTRVGGWRGLVQALATMVARAAATPPGAPADFGLLTSDFGGGR
jgi:hypothetical protein